MTAPLRVIWVLAVVAIPLVLVLVNTRSGLGITTDSVTYIAEARSLLAGGGLVVPTGVHEVYGPVDDDPRAVVSTQFPPMYPAVLAASGTVHHPERRVRWLNGALLGVCCVGLALGVAARTGSKLLGSLAALMFAASPVTLRTFSMVWSEPLFVALTILGLIALARYFETRRMVPLVLAALAIGLAWMTRYVGVASIVVGVIALFRYRSARWWRALIVFCVVSILPMVLWLGGAEIHGAERGGYSPKPHLISGEVVRGGARGIGNWILPTGRPSLPRVVLYIAIGLSLAWAVKTRGSEGAPAPPQASLETLPFLLVSFLVSYGVVVLASASALTTQVPVNERILFPAYAEALVLVWVLAGRAVRSTEALATVVVTAVAVLAVFTVGSAIPLAGRSIGDAVFGGRKWSDSAGLHEVGLVRPGTRIYSNFPDLIYYRTSAPARLLPRPDLPNGSPDPTYRSRMRGLADDVDMGRSVVVSFVGTGQPALQRDNVPPISDLSAAFGRPPDQILPDAVVWGVVG